MACSIICERGIPYRVSIQNPPFMRPRSLSKSIALVGLMGVGKSTVGRRLAKALNCAFLDADDEIEQAAGCTVNEIFERFGEDYFRDGERRVIARLIGAEPCVIATGGGAFVDEDTRVLLNAQAVTVWLYADVSLLVKRVSRRDTRPLLADKDPYKVLTDLDQKRRPFYAQAHIAVESGVGPHEKTVDAILAALDHHGGAFKAAE